MASFRDTHYHGSGIARDADDRMVGFVAYRIERTGPGKQDYVRTVTGPVRATAQDAQRDARDAFERERGE